MVTGVIESGAVGSGQLHNVRLIDIVKRCIVRVSTSDIPDYIALSYIWGVPEMERQTRIGPATLSREMMRQSLRVNSIPPSRQIPRTIEDAIQITQVLGFS